LPAPQSRPQVPAVQVAVAPAGAGHASQRVPHEATESLATQAPLQECAPARQVTPHTLFTQVASEVALLGHDSQLAPQLATTSSDTQMEPQACFPTPHTHAPPWHIAPVGQSGVLRQPGVHLRVDGSQA